MKLDNDDKRILKNDIKYLSIFLILFIVILKIIFWHESLLNILKLLLFLLVIFVPMMFILFSYRKKLDLLERSIFSIILGFAVYGVLSYNLGVIGLHVKYHFIFILILLIGIGIYVNHKSFL